MNEETPVLRVSRLGKSFGETCVLSDVSFSLPAASTLSVIGPSGCGKSTLLSLVAGLSRPSEGEITFPRDCRTAFAAPSPLHYLLIFLSRQKGARGDFPICSIYNTE